MWVEVWYDEERNTEDNRKEGVFMIPPRIVQYEGRLGTFAYSTADFEISMRYTETGSFEILSYRGRETDGSKIQVPEGLVNGSYLFEGKSLVTPPRLPKSLKNASYMFKNCVSLQRGAVLPDGVEKCGFMYQGCRSLVSCPDLPNTVVDAPYMFDGCSYLERSPRLSKRMRNIAGIYRGCRRLQEEPEIPPYVLRDQYMFRDCLFLNRVGADHPAVGNGMVS